MLPQSLEMEAPLLVATLLPGTLTGNRRWHSVLQLRGVVRLKTVNNIRALRSDDAAVDLIAIRRVEILLDGIL